MLLAMSTYEMQQWAMIVAGGVVFIGIVIAIVRFLRAQDAIWPACAKKFGIAFREEDGGSFTGPSTRSKILEGNVQGTPVRLVFTHEQSGRMHRRGTRAHARAYAPAQRAFNVQIERGYGFQPHFHAVPTGDPAFDRIVQMKCDVPDAARALVDPNVRAALAALPVGEYALSYDRGEICLSFGRDPSSLQDLEIPLHVVLASARARVA